MEVFIFVPPRCRHEFPPALHAGKRAYFMQALEKIHISMKLNSNTLVGRRANY